MQPQSSQNMYGIDGETKSLPSKVTEWLTNNTSFLQMTSVVNYIQSAAANGSSQVRSNQVSNLYRGASASPVSRNGARHVPMQAMYPQTMPQNVVVQPFPQYQRQAFQAPPYAQYSQPIQTNYPYPYPTYYPVTAQRNTVGVSTSIGVGNTISVQPGTNGPLTGPPGTAQTQLPLASGPMLTASAVPSSSNPAVLGVASNGGQVAVQSMVSVVQPTISAPSSQKSTRRRAHALEIIDPSTNKNILDEFDNQLASTGSDIEYPEKNVYMQQSMVVADSPINLQYDMLDIQQTTHDIKIGQTPVVSAITDGPSVEILPPMQKTCKSKRTLSIVNPKETIKNSEYPRLQQQSSGISDDTLVNKSECIQQQQFSIIRTSQPATEHEASENINNNNGVNEKTLKESGIPKIPGKSYGPELVNTTTLLTGIDQEVGIKKGKESLNDSQEGEFGKIELQKSALSQNRQQEHDLQSSETKVLPISAISLKEADLITKSEINQSILNSESTKIQGKVLQRKKNYIAMVEQSTSDKTLNEVAMDITNEIKTTKIINKLTTVDNNSSISVGENSDNESKDRSCASLINGIDMAYENNGNSEDRSQHKQALNEIALPPDQIISVKPTTSNLKPMLPPQETEKLLDLNSCPEMDYIHSRFTTTDIPTLNESEEGNARSEFKTSSPQEKSLISYTKDQWSPNNPSGRKKYDREQLLQLRDTKASRRQPDVSNISILPTSNLMPSFVRNPKRIQSMVGSTSNNRGSITNASGAASMSGVHGRGSLRGMIRVNLSLNQDVKLNETDNAWRPRVLEKDGDTAADPEAKAIREKEELIRRVRGILNKLTPEKFDALVEEIIKLKIDTPDKMEDVMVLVFEKAIDEPNFSVSYARLCHRLITEVKARDERMESGTKTNLAQFQAALLDKTEREFTQNVTKTKAKEEKLQPIIDEILKCTDASTKGELEAQLEEEERKIRRRSGGTVRFIGELFKISMLTGNIINSCIDALLNPNSEDQLECLCKLLTTVGAKFEQTPINPKESSRCYSLEKTISRMQSIASKSDKEGAKVSSRVRFMLQDVIDLRREKWKSKRNEMPKTMGQVEKEMKSEQLSAHFLNYPGQASGGISGSSISNGPSPIGNAGKREERGCRYNDTRSVYGGNNSQRTDVSGLRRQQGGSSSGRSSSGNDENTWLVQTSKGSRCLDTNKLEGLTTANNFDTKKMGGLSQFIWSTGSRQPSTSISAPTNSFAALSALGDTNRNNDCSRNGPRNKGSFHKGSIECDRFDMHPRPGSSSKVTQASRSTMGGPAGQKSTTSSKFTQQEVSPVGTTASKVLSSVEGLLHPQGITDTYPNLNSKTEKIAREEPLQSPTEVSEKFSGVDTRVLKSVVSDMLDIASNFNITQTSMVMCIQRVKESERIALLYYIMTDYLHLRHIGKLQRRFLGNTIVYLINNNLISSDQFILAYDEFCVIASDLVLDIPDLWKYMMEFTGPLISKGLLTVYNLWNKHLKEENMPSLGKIFLKIFLDYCSIEIGPNFTRNMWKNTSIKWSDFMAENETEAFKLNNGYQYIDDESIQPIIAVNEPHEDVINRVFETLELLLKDGASAESIIDYINGNLSEIDKSFVRNLASKLCDFAISYKENSYKLEAGKFQKICIPVLHRYIDAKEEYELECLYAMQLLVARLEHPRGLLSDLFGELYDADVISQDSFMKWRNSRDQSNGKGVAVKGLNPFFNHVLSSETSDENN